MNSMVKSGVPVRIFFRRPGSLSTADRARVMVGVVCRIAAALAVLSLGFTAATEDTAVVNATFVLRHDSSKVADLEQLLQEQTTPGHPQLGRHLSREQAKGYLTPHPDTTAGLAAWKTAHALNHRATRLLLSGVPQIELSLAEVKRSLGVSCRMGPRSKRVAGTRIVWCPSVAVAELPLLAPHVIHVQVLGHAPLNSTDASLDSRDSADADAPLDPPASPQTAASGAGGSGGGHSVPTGPPEQSATEARRPRLRKGATARRDPGDTTHQSGQDGSGDRRRRAGGGVGAGGRRRGGQASRDHVVSRRQGVTPASPSPTPPTANPVGTASSGAPSTSPTAAPTALPTAPTVPTPTVPPTPALVTGGTACYNLGQNYVDNFYFWPMVPPPPLLFGRYGQGTGTSGPTTTTLDLTVRIANFDGYVGSNFDPSRIPILPHGGCIYTRPLYGDNLTSWRDRNCSLNPFTFDPALMNNLTAINVYLNATVPGGPGGNRVFRFPITSNTNYQYALRPGLCVLTAPNPGGGYVQATLPDEVYREYSFHAQVEDSNFWLGQYWATVEAVLANGTSVAITQYNYFGQNPSPFTEPAVFIPSRPKLPTQMQNFYEASPLASVRSGLALNGSIPAVSSQYATWYGGDAAGYFDPADFARLSNESNGQGYAAFPLQPGQEQSATFVERPNITNPSGLNGSSAAQIYRAYDPEFNGTVSTIQNRVPFDPSAIEASLDTQWIGVTSRAQQTYLFHGGYFMQSVREYVTATEAVSTWGETVYDSSYGWAMQFLDVVLAIMYGEIQPDVLSMSFGYNLFAATNVWLPTVEVYYQLLSGMGITLLASTGDTGASGKINGGWADGMGGWSYPVNCSVFSTQFPATSPYVTAVGATQLVQDSEANPANCTRRWPPATATTAAGPCVKEIGQSMETTGMITSSGGFAQYITRRSWQDAAVNGYLATPFAQQLMGQLSSADTARMTTNRAVPDLSAVGHACGIYANGVFFSVDGTSCSAPLVAGMISLLNSELVSRGFPRIGYLNPWLYRAPPSVFNDVVEGSNRCVGQEQDTMMCCELGFNATAGWDPVTGLGSLRVGPFLEWFLSAAHNATLASTAPSSAPTSAPPTLSPSSAAPTSSSPTTTPTTVQTAAPTAAPTSASPTVAPAAVPTSAPTVGPTVGPTEAPSLAPAAAPTSGPSSEAPTVNPTTAPVSEPTATTMSPTLDPTGVPTVRPSEAPSASPAVAVTASPTVMPTLAPRAEPTTAQPTAMPTHRPSSPAPSSAPTARPVRSMLAPTAAPVRLGSVAPSVQLPPTPSPSELGATATPETTSPSGNSVPVAGVVVGCLLAALVLGGVGVGAWRRRSGATLSFSRLPELEMSPIGQAFDESASQEEYGGGAIEG
eukprot:m.416845 g.416845  ORF g.416845 m.416845 type:complete len:1379 (-) comp16830_c1_seq44:71-4207(-)